MLNITRRPGEQLRIGDDMLVTLLALPRSDEAKIKIEAPFLEDAAHATLAPGDEHRITEQIAITLTEIRAGEARLAIDAPRSVPVYREEVYQDRERRRRRRKGEHDDRD